MTPTQLLQLIESIAASDDAESVELAIAENRPVTERERRMAAGLMKIYTYVHPFTKHACKHPDWQAEAEEAYQRMQNEI